MSPQRAKALDLVGGLLFFAGMVACLIFGFQLFAVAFMSGALAFAFSFLIQTARTDLGGIWRDGAGDDPMMIRVTWIMAGLSFSLFALGLIALVYRWMIS